MPVPVINLCEGRIIRAGAPPMNKELSDFYLRADLSWRRLLQRLNGWGSLRVHPPATATRTLFDSFDWRLYRSGTVLEERRSHGEVCFIWRALGSGEVLCRMDGPVPAFARDLPPGTSRSRLARLMEMRAFLPLVEVQSRLQVVDGLNRDEKTVVRLTLENSTLKGDDASRNITLPGRVVVTPVKGYAKTRRGVVRFLRQELSLPPAAGDLMEEAVKAAGRRPGDYTAKLDLRLDPETPMLQALTQILMQLLDVMEANEPGVKGDLDSEFLHDFRVAVRRTRSALTQVKGVLDPDLLARFKPEFGWLGAVTGPTRDLDVYLLSYDDFRNSLPEAFRDRLAPLHHYLVVHQKLAHEKLVQELESERYRRLVHDWRTALQDTKPRAGLFNAERSVAEVAGERIWKVYRRVLREGRAIDDHSPPSDLHDLRKTCKKLRYLLEFFQGLYPPRKVKKLIKALKTLQENLGEFQDLQVQAEYLRDIGDEVIGEEDAPVSTLLAMGVLVEKLLERQRRARTEFAGRFRSFIQPANEGLFRKLFKPRKGDGSPR